MADATGKLRIIWTSMLGALVVYAALGFSGVMAPAQRLDLPLLPILACLSFAVAVMAVFLRGRLANFDTATIDPAVQLAARTRAAVVPWALDESIGVFGYVLVLTGHRPIEWLPFMAAGFALLLLHAPRNPDES
jgi:hypothetical protein